MNVNNCLLLDSTSWEYQLRDAESVLSLLGDADLVRPNVVGAPVQTQPMSLDWVSSALSARLHYIIYMGEGTIEIFVNAEDQLDCRPHMATYQRTF